MDCAFVGAGSVAGAYAEDVAESRLDLVAVCDQKVDRAETLARTHGATAYADLSGLLEAQSAPLVVNLTSHGSHAAVTEQCLEADRHVFSEKPLALEADRAEELVKTAEKRGLALDCAPINHQGPAQQHCRTFLSDGRFGPIRVGYAHAHVGRVTQWHDRPASFLEVGPLYDGGVYPLNLLASWFGQVARVRTADAIAAWPDREPVEPDRPAHVETTIEFEAGPVIRLTASMYAPHRSREFNSLELHGDGGSLYLTDTGGLDSAADRVQVAAPGREYVAAPIPKPVQPGSYIDGPDSLATAIAEGEQPTTGARRAAHVVAVLNAIEIATENRGPVVVEGVERAGPELPVQSVRPDREAETNASEGDGPRNAAIDLPPIGFGCSRYRDGAYVDRIDSIATALDAGYRLFDSAELYGNESRIGDLLDSPGAPDRESLCIVSKVWNTNHEHVEEACRGSLDELGLEALDCYMLHWPDAWAYRGPLRKLAEKPPETQEAVTFPKDDSGSPEQVDVPLTQTWERLEGLHDQGLVRSLGVCNVSLQQLREITGSARIQPAVVQVESHPYAPRRELIEACHRQGIRVMAHSPLSAPGLLEEPVVRDIATERGISPAAVVLAWNVSRGVVPIPSSNDRRHIVENLAAAGHRLDRAEQERVETLEDPDFER